MMFSIHIEIIFPLSNNQVVSSWTRGATTFIRLNIEDPFLLSIYSSRHQSLLSKKYLLWRMDFHQRYLLVINLQNIFEHNAIFTRVGSLMPKPPCSREALTIFRFMRWNLFMFEFPPFHTFFLIYWETWCMTPFGASIAELWKIDMAITFDFTRITHPIGFNQCSLH